MRPQRSFFQALAGCTVETRISLLLGVEPLVFGSSPHPEMLSTTFPSTSCISGQGNSGDALNGSPVGWRCMFFLGALFTVHGFFACKCPLFFYSRRKSRLVQSEAMLSPTAQGPKHGARLAQARWHSHEGGDLCRSRPPNTWIWGLPSIGPHVCWSFF